MNKIKQRIVATNTFQLVTARLHQWKRFRQLKEMYPELISKYAHRPALLRTDAPSSYIWLCWWQGRNHMPPLVEECYRRIAAFHPDKQVVLITEENMEKYVRFPSYIMEKFHAGMITKTHMSDLLRAELLARYGGVWMDATLYVFSPVPDCFYQKTVYTGRCPLSRKDHNVSRNRWTSYFWVSPYPEHVLFCFLSDFWHAYWKDHDSLMEYLLIDYVIDLGYCTIPAIKESLDQVDLNGCGTDFWALLSNLHKPYSPQLLSDIRKANWMQKLTYRIENSLQQQAADLGNSMYQTLFLNRQGSTKARNGATL